MCNLLEHVPADEVPFILQHHELIDNEIARNRSARFPLVRESGPKDNAGNLGMGVTGLSLRKASQPQRSESSPSR